MKLVTVTDMATGMLVDLDPEKIFYVRISEKMSATIIVSVGGAFVACREPKDEVMTKWQEAKNYKPEAPKLAESTPPVSGINPGLQVGNNPGGQ